MMDTFAGKTVFVTGAGQGIGYEICRQFAQVGATVGLNDIDASLTQQAVQQINEEVGKTLAFPYPFDISDVKAMRAAIADFDGRFGRFDCLVANAGVTQYGDFLSYEPAQFDRLMAINLRGTYFSAQAAAKTMIAKNISGRIVLLSSITGIKAHPSLSAYGMTKAAIRMLAMSLALELGPHGITTNAIAPGATLTERTQVERADYAGDWQRLIPNGRIAEVSDIAAATLFLASEQARHISGQTLTIDGGWGVYGPVPE